MKEVSNQEVIARAEKSVSEVLADANEQESSILELSLANGPHNTKPLLHTKIPFTGGEGMVVNVARSVFV